jgi:hypothetical protein
MLPQHLVSNDGQTLQRRGNLPLLREQYPSVVGATRARGLYPHFQGDPNRPHYVGRRVEFKSRDGNDVIGERAFDLPVEGFKRR